MQLLSPSKANCMHLPTCGSKDAFVTLVTARTKEIRDEVRNKSTKKTLTIPQWLNGEADTDAMNLSQVLQYARKEKLSMT